MKIIGFLEDNKIKLIHYKILRMEAARDLFIDLMIHKIKNQSI